MAIKVIYLNIGKPTQGVVNKLNDKIDCMKLAGLDVQIKSIELRDAKNNNPRPDVVLVNAKIISKLSKIPFFWRLEAVVSHFLLYKAMAAQAKHWQVDFIILRYPTADFFFWWYLKSLRIPVVFEHNTIEALELNIRRKNSFYYQYSYWSERLFGKSARLLAKGLVCVTGEIAAHQQARSNFNVPTVVVSNGIKVNRLPIKRVKKFDGRSLNLLFLAGSDAPWHGLDVLDDIMRQAATCNVHCFVAGGIAAIYKEKLSQNRNMTLLPLQTQADLNLLVNDCHIGISSLGFEGFLKQACTLKVREYWGRGLPFVLGYDDTDLLDMPEMKDFYFQVQPADGIKLQAIVDFAKRVYEIENVSEKMRQLALRKIDYSVKAGLYLNFLTDIRE
ncbi:MAG: glycosyltransferase [Bacteroidota bacterium]